ncbi:hypothetical protein [Streptomyces sp. NPDC020983]|uniref:hypothetical protein n=1 Tax=Streptomyces sp. NPDC020983 TaxID=3365106 RepID=UPI0037AB9860
MPRPLDDTKRAAILTDIRAGKLSRNAIARKHGVGAATVTKLAKTTGDATTFDRSQTQKATRAVEADSRARRAALAADLLDDAARLRARAWEEYTVVVGTAQGAETVTLELPPLGDVRSAYTAVGIVVDKHLALDRHDHSGGADVTDAVSMLTNLAAGIRRIAEQEADSGG